jgi:CMP/dCMP kinase
MNKTEENFSSHSKSWQKIVTIDGPAASGKSSVSREIAKRLGWSWVSTGAFYRGLGYVALELGVDLEDVQGLTSLAGDRSVWSVVLSPEKTQVFLYNQDVTTLIHHEDVGAIASRISQIPQVRASLLEAQRECYQESQGLVAEGRDCGTVVFPQARVKIFLTADEASRAMRRAQEQGLSVTQVSQQHKQRDAQDQGRKVAPLTQAPGAIVVDTSYLNLEQVVSEVFALVTQGETDCETKAW